MRLFQNRGSGGPVALRRGALRGAEPPAEGVGRDLGPAAGGGCPLLNSLVGVLEQAQIIEPARIMQCQ
jgi:hypothetical protein